jgi:FkbM family methyltransferase
MARWKDLATLWKSLRGTKRKRGRPPREHEYFQQLLAACDIASVIDVGANAGQFGRFLRERVAYTGRIISIEPLPDAFEALTRRAAADRGWTAMQLALGDSEGVLPINVAGNSLSSSLLPMLARHEAAAPRSRYHGRVDVRVERLDSVPELCAATDVNCMLKIDAQGYELPVLRGADGLLDRFSLLYLEVSLVPLYESGALVEDVIAYLRQRGFAPVAIHRGFTDRFGQQLQSNILFANVARMPAMARREPGGRI